LQAEALHITATKLDFKAAFRYLGNTQNPPDFWVKPVEKPSKKLAPKQT